jgi:hypothetical protein
MFARWMAQSWASAAAGCSRLVEVAHAVFQNFLVAAELHSVYSHLDKISLCVQFHHNCNTQMVLPEVTACEVAEIVLETWVSWLPNSTSGICFSPASRWFLPQLE